MAKELTDYNESSIKSLDWREHIRLRPGMYIGKLGDGANCTLEFTEPAYGVAPGQAAVIYAGERVVGGGWIDTTQSA